MYEVEQSNIDGVFTITPKRFEDDRGFLTIPYNRDAFDKIEGVPTEFQQQNLSRSKQNVLRGLHYQLNKPQAKLVRCTRGKIFDVAVDIRVGSPTFGQWYGHELSAENCEMLFVPRGFAHGFYTLEDQCDVLYMVDNDYDANGAYEVIWNDPTINIKWPDDCSAPQLSEKDSKADTLKALMEKGLLPQYE